jgi:hypothetical protein
VFGRHNDKKTLLLAVSPHLVSDKEIFAFTTRGVYEP